MDTITLKGANHGFKLSELCYTGACKNILFSQEGKQMLKGEKRKYELSSQVFMVCGKGFSSHSNEDSRLKKLCSAIVITMNF
jgi:hypothetical protein